MHGFSGTDLNTVWIFTSPESFPAQVTLEHDSPTHRQYVLPESVKPYPSLSLGYRPWTDSSALCPSETEALVYVDRAFPGFMVNPERTEFGTGRIITMHTTPGDGQAFAVHLHLLHEQPVVGSESICQVALV
jgi:hypothetical protein